jgi:hypothetical protein
VRKKSSKLWCGSPVGPTRVHRVGKATLGEKRLRFWQKHSLNCDSLVLHSPSTLSTSKNI